MQKIQKVEEIGILIRAARKMQGLTQEQLSAASGVGIRFIRELEQGKPSCQIGKVLMVVQMLGFHLLIAKRGEI